MDSRGIKRGKCKKCPKCSGYKRCEEVKKEKPASNLCQVCGCYAGQHVRTDSSKSSQSQPTIKAAGITPAVISVIDLNGLSGDFITKCCVSKCKEDAHIILNTGEKHRYCESHLHSPPPPDDNDAVDGSSGIPPSTSIKDPNTCAIEDCSNPRHVDPSGKIHECCGYTHAMELQRRKIIGKQKSAEVKGQTHCFLPGCNRIVWPFMNYCGKSHAEEGRRRKIKPPAHLTSNNATVGVAKDSSLCQLPGCTRKRRPKSADGTTRYDFCGKTHADEAKKGGITIAASDQHGTPKTSDMCMLAGCYNTKRNKSDGSYYDYCCLAHAEAAAQASASLVTSEDDICLIPKCKKPKYIDPATKEVHNFCSKKHVEEGEKRGIKPVLTSMSDVKKFLESFSSILKVVKIDENDHAKPGGTLYQKFITARNTLSEAERTTCLAFHGTPGTNIDSICANGYDPLRRKGQAHGPGEYFATTPGTPLGYCHGDKKILLNELLLGRSGVHHTQQGDIVVMKSPEHDLPRFVISFS